MIRHMPSTLFFLLNVTPSPRIYTLSLHDALPICFDFAPPCCAISPRFQITVCSVSRSVVATSSRRPFSASRAIALISSRSEEHTSELQSHSDLVCRLLLEKKKFTNCDCLTNSQNK